MKRRTSLAVTAQKSIEEMFKKSKASLEEKAKVYKSVVKHVLTYNYSTWGLSKNEQDHLDRFHRKQLRRLCPSLKEKSNNEVYEICKDREISKDMKIARWNMFGHVLRLPRDTPAQLAMDFYFETPMHVEKFKGNQEPHYQ